MFSLITFLHRAIMQGIPLLFGSTGEIMTGAGKEIRKERSDGIASKKASVTKFGHSRIRAEGEESREKKKN